MKASRFVCCLVAGGIWLPLAGAQDGRPDVDGGPGFMPPPAVMEGEPGGPMHPGHHPPPDAGFDGHRPPSASKLDEWMEFIRQTEPQNYEQFQRWREQNPMILRQQMRRRLVAHEITSVLDHYPTLRAAFDQLSPEDRERCVRELVGRAPPFPAPGGCDPRPPDSPELCGLDNDARAMIKEYRAASEDAVRQEIRARLKANIEKQFDLRTQARQAMIKQMGEKIGELKARLAQRQERRDQIIAKRLDDMLRDESMAW